MVSTLNVWNPNPHFIFLRAKWVIITFPVFRLVAVYRIVAIFLIGLRSDRFCGRKGVMTGGRDRHLWRKKNIWAGKCRHIVAEEKYLGHRSPATVAVA